MLCVNVSHYQPFTGLRTSPIQADARYVISSEEAIIVYGVSDLMREYNRDIISVTQQNTIYAFDEMEEKTLNLWDILRYK